MNLTRSHTDIVEDIFRMERLILLGNELCDNDSFIARDILAIRPHVIVQARRSTAIRTIHRLVIHIRAFLVIRHIQELLRIQCVQIRHWFIVLKEVPVSLHIVQVVNRLVNITITIIICRIQMQMHRCFILFCLILLRNIILILLLLLLLIARFTSIILNWTRNAGIRIQWVIRMNGCILLLRF